MPKIRIGLSTDFNLLGEQVGIGTTNPTARVEVAGQILADNTAGSGGVSTYREYQGFHQTQSGISHKVTIDATTAGNLNSLSGELRIDGDVTIASDTSVTSGKIDSLTATDKFAVPLGETNNRDNAPEAGTTRFNQDFGTIEFFDGINWKTVNSYSRGGAAGRGVFGGGNNPNLSPTIRNDIDFVNIQTLGNAQDFGDLTLARNNVTGCSSEIRGIFGQGNTPTYQDRIDYITIASQGNAIDFGNISTTNRAYASGCSSSTRGLFNGGYTTSPSAQTVNIIDRIEISTVGNAVDFGDLFHKVYGSGSASSPTRAIVAGGVGTPDLGTDPSIRFGQIQKYEIGSGGTSIDFGQLSESRWSINGMSNGTRGVFGGGQKPTYLKLMDFVTISSEGNAVQFGDLSEVKQGSGQASSKTRGLFHSGRTPSNPQTNRIEYINMTSLGDAIDFGDATTGRSRMGGFSDSHGGLGGF